MEVGEPNHWRYRGEGGANIVLAYAGPSPSLEGTLRMCIDYRGLNAITAKNREPLPRIDDLLDRAQGCRYLSKIDLKSRYHQIAIRPEDQHKTAFQTKYGLYEFVVMPFGLCNAPGTFQHAMNRIFHDYLDKFVIVYLDDVLIFSKTVEEHVAHLDKVLSLLRHHKFKINGEKCEFGCTRVLYLGHEISAEGLKPDDAKVANICEWPRPQYVTEMRSFLGMIGYYKTFVKNYSIVAAPLTDLTRLHTPWEWTDECEVAFRHLKHALTHYEVLKLLDPDKPFIVTTDASQYGIGAVLAQQEGPKLRPVEYMSKKMPSQKLAKSTYEKELYAVYKALTHWRHYLLGRFFILRTDHQTLRWMRTQSVLSDALKRWIEVIEQYDFDPQYLKGEYNKVADALSRRPDFSANLLQRFWWPTMMRDAQLYVETCQVCQRDKPRTEAPLGLLKPLPIPERPGESLSMDLMDTLVTSKSGMRHIFVIVDRFSKYARLVAMPETAKTEYVIRMFKENWVRDFGLPKSIISDRDVRFTSELWKAAAVEQGTQLQMTSGNHPEANGQAEQLNRAVQHLLRHYIKPNQVDWDEKLALIASLYNSVVHSATVVSPNCLLLTFKPRLPLDFLLPENHATAAPGTLEFAYRYEQKMQQAVEQMQKAQAAMIESANKHCREPSFQVGDRVWVKSSKLGQEHEISRKLMPQYFGPWEVLDIVGTDPEGPSYIIRIPGHLRTYPVFHASKLAPFEETDQFPPRRSMLPPTMDGEVDIDDIVDHRELPVSRPTGRGRPPKPKLQYRVRFRHHTDPKEDRWFTKEELMQTAPQVMGKLLRITKLTHLQGRSSPHETMGEPSYSKGIILTIEEQAIWAEYPEVVRATTSADLTAAFAKHVMAPLLGEEYVNPGVPVDVTREFLDSVFAAINPLRPSFRIYNGPQELPSGRALIIPDHCHLSGSADDVSGACLQPTICVEIKPKWGFIPSADTIRPSNEVKKRVIHYKMHQQDKLARHLVKSVSNYDPRDLFSGDQARMMTAMRALFRNPQNNLRVFREGNQVYGAGKSEVQTVVQARMRKAGNGNSNAPATDLCGPGMDWDLEGGLETFCPLRGSQREQALQELVVAALLETQVLDGLLRAQRLDQYDIEGVIHVFEALMCGAQQDSNVADADTECDSNSAHAGNGHFPAGGELGASSGGLEDEVKLRAELERLKALPRDECIRVVRDFLIAATAKDCSLLISMRRVIPSRCTRPQGSTGTPEMSMADGLGNGGRALSMADGLANGGKCLSMADRLANGGKCLSTADELANGGKRFCKHLTRCPFSGEMYEYKLALGKNEIDFFASPASAVIGAFLLYFSNEKRKGGKVNRP
ncbi:hypothetical protein CBR_g22893 [Chara braunii]|uniref:Uncharacterized protein n=1 Tax=Chara braunii TaxID=69332 RepID=A0A388L309_CHABU|nr:hypothetical protein CBR_g22893 [Chara braunii]|eukprot:GBG76676.1 hypothetical protein CBR_g22893 [Chara braunii]